MSKQDTNGVRTAQDLERKYDFSSLGKLNKNYELQKENLTKVEKELNNFLKQITKNIVELQDQVDGNITAWFFSGVPFPSKDNLEEKNSPSSEWNDDDDKNNHLGDLYYDKDTGCVYKWSYEDNNYLWVKVNDVDLAQVLAIANASQDTTDSKRRIFIEQPFCPYDVGDLWIKNDELYRCQISKDDKENFEEDDWIIATDYTNGTVANKIGNILTIFSGTVTTIKDNVDEISNVMTNTTKLVDGQGTAIGTIQQKQSATTKTVEEISSSVSAISTDLNNNYTNNEELEQKLEDQKASITKEMSTQFNQTMDTFTFDIIKKINEDGVTTLKNTIVTIDESGINTAKNNEDVVSLLDNKGFYVSDGKKKEDSSNVVMKVDRNGAYFKTSEVKSTIKEQDIIQKEKTEDEKYGECQSWYWIGSDE
jgi:hypothetical protein